LVCSCRSRPCCHRSASSQAGASTISASQSTGKTSTYCAGELLSEQNGQYSVNTCLLLQIETSLPGVLPARHKELPQMQHACPQSTRKTSTYCAETVVSLRTSSQHSVNTCLLLQIETSFRKCFQPGWELPPK
jgi:hypothetical protein